MSLMTLVRLIGAVVIGWTLVAIGIGASGARLNGREVTPLLPHQSPAVEAMPTSWPSDELYELVDRTTGRRSPIRLPDGDRWSIISVSPWRGSGGEVEAVGRWVNPNQDAFCGWGVFRLSDGAVLHRAATKILPSGRPCWVPGPARTILFSATDGRLHHCRLDLEDDEPPREPVVGAPGSYDATSPIDRSDPVVWEIAPPGSGEPLVLDPLWPDDPRLKKWVFVALSPLERRLQSFVYGPSQLWWLEMSEDARTVVAAGPLTETSGPESASTRIDERFPNVAVGVAGDIRLVYLERPGRHKEWRLRLASLELDARTGRPRAVNGAENPAASFREGFRPAALLVSADGSTVYGVSGSGGLVTVPAVGRRGPADSNLARDHTSSRP
jgi:hypothetical protein